MAENTPSQINRHPCGGRGPSRQRSAKLTLPPETFAALKWIPSCEGMTKCPKHKRSVTPAKPDSAPAKAGDPSQQRSSGLDVGVIRHSLRSHGSLPAQGWPNKIMTLGFQSPLRRQGSISATERKVNTSTRDIRCAQMDTFLRRYDEMP